METIIFRVDAETKARFLALARSEESTASNLLRQIVGNVLTTNTGWEAEAKSGHRGGVAGKLGVRLQQDEIEQVRALAVPERRSAAAWIVGLVRAKLNGAVPFNPDELKALKDASQELATVGRNLNTLVHHFNRSGRADADSVRVAELMEAVLAVKREMLEMRDRAMKRYGSE